MPVALLVRLVVWLWFGAAVAAGHFILLRPLPALTTPALMLGLPALLLLAYFRLAPFRDWVDGLDLRWLVVLHLTRFIGIYFLILSQRGELPRAFAASGAIGGIIVAAFALPVAFAPLAPDTRLRALVIWNVVGLIDLLLLTLTTARLAVATPWDLRALTQLPLGLLPTFLVPLLLASHVVIFVRAARPQRAA